MLCCVIGSRSSPRLALHLGAFCLVSNRSKVNVCSKSVAFLCAHQHILINVPPHLNKS